MPRFQVKDVRGTRYFAFHCPGCNQHHQINDSWSVKEDRDADHLTILPSILVTGTQDLTEEEYRLVVLGKPVTRRPLLCHSYITKGRIKFLADSIHGLAGQTVDIPEWPYASDY